MLMLYGQEPEIQIMLKWYPGGEYYIDKGFPKENDGDTSFNTKHLTEEEVVDGTWFT